MDDWNLDTPEKAQAGPVGPPPSSSEEQRKPRPDREPKIAGSPEGRIGRSQAPPKRDRRRMLPWVAAAFGILVVGILAGFFVGHSFTAGDRAALSETRAQLSELERALSQSEDRLWNYYRANEALRAQLEQEQSGGSASPSTTVPGPGQDRIYGDGVFIVGEDIAPGTYDGVVDGQVGYWARLKDTDGYVSSIIANAIPRGPFELTIYSGDRAVELRGVVITARRQAAE